MKNQLRIYTINRGQMDAFVKAWQEGVVPLRLKLGFQVSTAWINRETNQFMWVVSYNGPKTWEEVEQAYYNAPERKTLSPDPVQLIARIETFFVERAPWE